MSRKAKLVPQIRIDEFVANLNHSSITSHEAALFKFEDISTIETISERKLPSALPKSVRDDIIERSVQIATLVREMDIIMRDLSDAAERSLDKRFAARERKQPRCKCCGQVTR